MILLDDLACTECGCRGCVSWAVTEGGRCLAHSSYVGPRRDAAQKRADESRAERRAAFRGSDAEFAGHELDAALRSRQ